MTQGVADTSSLVDALLGYSAAAFVVIVTLGITFYLIGVNTDAGSRHSSSQRTGSIPAIYSGRLSQMCLCRKLGIASGLIRRFLGLLFIMLVVVPFMLNTAMTFCAVLLVAAERWSFYDSFIYVWQDTFGIGPFVNISPISTVGSWLDMLVSLLLFVLAQVVLGITGGLDINNTLIDMMPKTVFGFLRVIFIYSPLCMILIVLTHATALARLEGWDLFNSVAYVVDILCNIENGLTDDSPISTLSLFLSSLFLGVTLCAAGSVITVVGSHPVIISFVVWVNGQMNPEDVIEGPPTPQSEPAGEDPSQEPDSGPAQEADSGPAKELEAAGSIETRIADSKQHLHPVADVDQHLHRVADGVSRTPTSPSTPLGECRAQDAKSSYDWLNRGAPDDNGLREQGLQVEIPRAVQAEKRATMSTSDSQLDNVKVDEEAWAQVEKLRALLAEQEAERAAELQRFGTLLAARDGKVAAQDAELRQLQAALSSHSAELELSRRALEASHQRELKLHSASREHNVDHRPRGVGHMPTPWSTGNAQLKPVVVVQQASSALRPSRSAPVVGNADAAASGSGRF